MIKQEFVDHTKVVQAWVLAMIASWYDDLEKISNLVMKYVGTPEKLDLFDKTVDSWFIAQFPEMNMFGINGTKNGFAWVSDIDAFGHDFHSGIFESAEHVIVPEFSVVKNDQKPTIGSGQSRGGALALATNYLLKKQGYCNIETWNFSGPYITTNSGKEKMSSLGIRHTNFVTDPYGELPSDPTDDVGVFKGSHYGHIETLLGGASVFDHSYLNITYKLVVWLLKQYSEKRESKYINDAVFLAGLIERGNDLIKK